MNRIAGREFSISKNNLFSRTQHVAIYAQDIVHSGKQRVECWLDRVTAVNRYVAVKDLLENFDIGYQSQL